MTKSLITTQKILALNESIKDILSNFREMSLDERLYLVAKNAADLAGAETCGILMKNDGFLTLEASYGHKKGRFIKGTKLAIRSGRKTGLTGHIAYHRKVFSANGKELTSHPAVRGAGSHTPSGYCYSLLMVPLRRNSGKRNNQIIAWLRLDNKKGPDGKPGADIPFTKEDQLILSFFSNMVIGALDIASLVDQLSNEQQRLQEINNKLQSLYNSSNILLSSRSPQQMLRRIVEEARVTMQAEFVSVIMLDRQNEIFELETSWDTAKHTGKKRYTARMIRGNGHTKYILEHKTPVIVEDIDLYDAKKYNNIVINAFTKRADFRSILGFPLILNDKAIGVIWFHFSSPHPSDIIEQELMQIYSNQAALAYDQAVQIDKTKMDLAASEKVLDATARGEYRNSLQELVAYALDALACSAVVLFQYDATSKRFRGNAIHAGLYFPQKVQKERDKRSIVYKILKHKGPYRASNVNEDKLFRNRRFVEEEKIESCVAISLTAANRPVGVMFINYRDKHEFTETEIQKINRFANQAAISIGYLELVRQIKKQSEEIAALYISSESILKDLSVVDTLDQIAQAAHSVASHMIEDSSCVSYITNVRENELVLQSVYPGRYRDILNHTVIHVDLDRDRSIGIVGKVVKENKIINSGDVSKISDYIAAIEGTKSQISLPLRFKNTVIGVLSIECNKAFAFSKETQFYLQSLASHAEIALEKNLLINQLSTIQESVKTIADASVVGDLQSTLETLVNESKKALGCGGVAIYLYDEEHKNFILPETRTPLRYPERQAYWKGFKTNPFDFDVINRGEMLTIDNINNPDIFKSNKFVKAENIKAFVVIPLIVRRTQKVGIMFVNYYVLKNITDTEISTMRLLADQAAVAIHNSLLYDQTERRAETLSALYAAGNAISSTLISLEIKKTLQEICLQAKKMVRLGSHPDCFSHLALLQENFLVYIASSNKAILKRLEKGDSVVDLQAKGRIGIAGRAVIEKKTLNIANVNLDPDYQIVNKSINSQLSIPLRIQEQIIGVLSIEHPDLNAFSIEDMKNIELLSSQATAAVVSANLYKQTLLDQEQRKKDLQGIAHSIISTVIGFASTIENIMLKKYKYEREQTQAYRDLLNLAQMLSMEARIFEIAANNEDTIFAKEKLKFEEVSGGELVEILKESIRLYKSYAESNGLIGPILYKSTLEKFRSFRLDRGLFNVMINSLIHNAIEYSNPKTKISVRGYLHEEHQEIVIINTGLPIHEYEMEDIFKQYYRSGSARSFRKHGSGLGLYVSNLIAGLHDCEIYAKPSRKMKNGLYRNQFVIVLPIRKGSSE